jgi:hypothetical protein
VKNQLLMALHYSATFIDPQELVCGNIREMLFRATGPLDIDALDDGVLCKAERKGEIALRAITASATDHVPLLAERALDANHRA